MNLKEYQKPILTFETFILLLNRLDSCLGDTLAPTCDIVFSCISKKVQFNPKWRFYQLQGRDKVKISLIEQEILIISSSPYYFFLIFPHGN